MKFSRNLKGLMLAAAASAVTASGAMAADLTPIMTTPTTVVATPAPSFAWAGTYAGIGGAVMFCSGACWINADAHVGYNMVFGNILAGIEGQVGYWFDFGSDSWFLGASGRLGYVLGQALVYAEAGVIGYFPTSVDYYVPLNVGVEFGIGQAVSVFAEGGAQWQVGTSNFFPSVGVGVNFHIGG